MRVLVCFRSLGEAGRRLHMAAAGMALRGHVVRWHGADPPMNPVQGSLGQAGRLGQATTADSFTMRYDHTDVVLGGPTAPASTVVAGWLAGARAMIFTVVPAVVGRWGWIDRWCWESLHSWGLVEPGDRDQLEATHPVFGRLSCWSTEPPPDEPDPGHPDTEILERLCERLLARARGVMPRRAVFLDRDGTLVVERGYLANPGDVELLPGVPQALRLLREAGYALVVISNQSGVGRGFFPVGSVHAAMARLRTALRMHGVELDAVYFCPHRPDDGCACRKPGTGLLEQAAQDLGLSLPQSVMIGDKLLDVATGQRAGTRTVLVRSGYGADEASRLPSPDLTPSPDQVCDDLVKAAVWLLAREMP